MKEIFVIKESQGGFCYNVVSATDIHKAQELMNHFAKYCCWNYETQIKYASSEAITLEDGTLIQINNISLCSSKNNVKEWESDFYYENK